MDGFPLTNTALARFLAGLLYLLPVTAIASDDHPKLFVQATKHLEVIYYSPSHEYLVTNMIRAYENALQFQRNLFHYAPSDRLTVLIEDFGDGGHGAARAVPHNFINIGMSPFNYTYETMPANERMTWIMNHESTHIAMQDGANATDRRWRRIFFGKVNPNADKAVLHPHHLKSTASRIGRFGVRAFATATNLRSLRSKSCSAAELGNSSNMRSSLRAVIVRRSHISEFHWLSCTHFMKMSPVPGWPRKLRF